MLEFKDVSFTYKNSNNKVLDRVNFKINKGECILLTGVSGSGKSTLIHLMNGLIPTLYEGQLEGEILFKNKDLKDIESYDISKNIGYVSQDPRGHFFTTNTTSELVFSMENYGIPLNEMKKKYSELVNLLELEKLVDKNIIYISSGERQKIAIGCSLSLEPEIIILDEPSSNLDFHMTKKLKQLIEKLKTKGYTIIIAEHRMYYIQDLIDRVFVINNGKVIEKTISDLKSNNEVPLRSLDIFNLELENISCKNKELLMEINNITYKNILSNITTTVYKGDVIGLIGKNGVGKTTLLRLLSNIMKPNKGKIVGKVVPFLVMQDMDYQFFTESVESEMKFGSADNDLEKINSLLMKLGLIEFKDKIPFELSGGQKQRLLIAISALANVNLLMFDEPTSGLDYVNMTKVSGILKDLSKNSALIVATHDIEFLYKTCNRVVYLDDKVIKEDFYLNLENKKKVNNIFINMEGK
ncbi:ABC transporter ATP-binding protein [Gemella sanguinis]|jgi:ABC superfamily ATP binding cassette transporter, ABC protein|uniref:ABC transporter ATP-binding protein n=1 Tax=Gemella sanguinis TaxID=84135 RepID=A0A2N6SE94_9BACL|nr:ABC transporter ATP-binding protein [Gemella sanguinis]PMC52240.1 ABC transporter ATP-binding protein [Gemella sanguinis]